MKRREEKAKVREVWQQMFAGIDPDDDAARASRVRDLCPCEFKWSVPLWDIIFAACDDPSPLVRVEALHVIEDAQREGFATAGGMARLYAAQRDPAPQVRRFVNDVLAQRPRVIQHQNRKRDQRMQKKARRQDEHDG
jgi:hypothetical protein